MGTTLSVKEVETEARRLPLSSDTKMLFTSKIVLKTAKDPTL
jgi:hypothetical protein